MIRETISIYGCAPLKIQKSIRLAVWNWSDAHLFRDLTALFGMCSFLFLLDFCCLYGRIMAYSKAAGRTSRHTVTSKYIITKSITFYFYGCRPIMHRMSRRRGNAGTPHSSSSPNRKKKENGEKQLLDTRCARCAFYVKKERSKSNLNAQFKKLFAIHQNKKVLENFFRLASVVR